MNGIARALMFIGGFAFVAGAAAALLPIVGLTLRSAQENNISQAEAAIFAGFGLALWIVGAMLAERY